MVAMWDDCKVVDLVELKGFSKAAWKVEKTVDLMAVKWGFVKVVAWAENWAEVWDELKGEKRVALMDMKSVVWTDVCLVH